MSSIALSWRFNRNFANSLSLNSHTVCQLKYLLAYWFIQMAIFVLCNYINLISNNAIISNRQHKRDKIFRSHSITMETYKVPNNTIFVQWKSHVSIDHWHLIIMWVKKATGLSGETREVYKSRLVDFPRTHSGEAQGQETNKLHATKICGH